MQPRNFIREDTFREKFHLVKNCALFLLRSSHWYAINEHNQNEMKSVREDSQKSTDRQDRFHESISFWLFIPSRFKRRRMFHQFVTQQPQNRQRHQSRSKFISDDTADISRLKRGKLESAQLPAIIRSSACSTRRIPDRELGEIGLSRLGDCNTQRFTQSRGYVFARTRLLHAFSHRRSIA